jgi:hypothetical protein
MQDKKCGASASEPSRHILSAPRQLIPFLHRQRWMLKSYIQFLLTEISGRWARESSSVIRPAKLVFVKLVSKNVFTPISPEGTPHHRKTAPDVALCNAGSYVCTLLPPKNDHCHGTGTEPNNIAQERVFGVLCPRAHRASMGA